MDLLKPLKTHDCDHETKYTFFKKKKKNRVKEKLQEKINTTINKSKSLTDLNYFHILSQTDIHYSNILLPKDFDNCHNLIPIMNIIIMHEHNQTLPTECKI